MAVPEHHLRIGELSRRAGVSPELLRAWERRYGLLRPARSAGGYRLYSADDEARIRRMQAHLSEGLSAAEAARLAAAAVGTSPPEGSLFAALRWGPLAPAPRTVPKRFLIRLSHAVEDECSSRAERGLAVGAFQRQQFFEVARGRWGELARGAQRALVFADFAEARTPEGGPAEVPIVPGDPLEREWAIAYLGPSTAVLFAGRELLGEAGVPDDERRFELVWSCEPSVVLGALRTSAELAERTSPAAARGLRGDLEAFEPPTSLDPTFVTALTNRLIGYLAH
jgi:DNA-binding transcriptional MerR regulator